MTLHTNAHAQLSTGRHIENLLKEKLPEKKYFLCHYYHRNMPDYLGKDQRTVRGDDEKEDKPIQGIFVVKKLVDF